MYGTQLHNVQEETSESSISPPQSPRSDRRRSSLTAPSLPTRAPPPLVRSHTQSVIYGAGGVPGPTAGYPHLMGRRSSLVGGFVREQGETKVIEKLNALTDEASEDDDELAGLYSTIKRRISAPAGLTKTLYNLYINRSRRSRNSVYSIDPSLLERPGRIREINSMEEFKERLDQAKEALVCVTFSAKWCGPWRMIKPDVHRLSHIHGDVEFYEIDVDDNEEIAEARRVACMPTFQFFKRGIMLDKFAEPNRIKLDETIRKLRKMEIRPEE